MKKSHVNSLTILSLGLGLVGGGCWNASQQTVETQPSAASTDTATTTKQKAPTPTQVMRAPTTKTAAHTSVVQILSGNFSPQVVAIAVGDTVVWQNKDTISHTSHSDGALIWDTGSIAPGASASHTFKSPGSYAYSDASKGLKGTVIVR